VTGAFGPYLVWNRAKFLVTQGVFGFAREEDVDLGMTVRAGANLAPRAFGYERDGIAPLVTARVGAKIPGGFGFLEGLAGGMYTSAGLDSGVVQLAATGVVKPTRGHVGIVHVETGWIENPLPGAEFDLGLGSGPRAFRSHAFTGDRTVFATAEYRVTVADDFLGLVGLGIAGFVDHGGAWYAGTPRRLGWDAGLGLRLGDRHLDLRCMKRRRCGLWRIRQRPCPQSRDVSFDLCYAVLERLEPLGPIHAKPEADQAADDPPGEHATEITHPRTERNPDEQSDEPHGLPLS